MGGFLLGKRVTPFDTIGIVAPASAEKKETIDESLKILKNLGFNYKCGKHIYDKWGYLAGKDEDRASDFITMLKDPTINMILCLRGGYGSIRILPYLNPSLLKKNPKIIAGFSDITVLLNYITKATGLITFHSPMVTSNLKDEETFKSFVDTFTHGYEPYEIKNPESIPYKTLINGDAEGKLVGGNLTLMCSSLGTPYEIDTQDKILFIEDVAEEPYRIDRGLTQLLLAGKLQKCKGFILGQFKDCSLPHYERSLTLQEIFEDRILPFKKPTISNFMAGHDYPRLTLPIGAKVKLDADLGIINVLEKVVS